MNTVFEHALKMVSQNDTPFGISIDIDGLDPHEAPATAITSAPGIQSNALIPFLKHASKHPQYIGLEIAEFFPYLDVDNLTEKLIAECMKAV